VKTYEDTPEARLREALKDLHPSTRYVRVEVIDLGAFLQQVDRERETSERRNARIVELLEEKPTDGITLRGLINQLRPEPEPDEQGDTACLRLWPVARCMYTSGHYGGCASA